MERIFKRNRFIAAKELSVEWYAPRQEDNKK